MLGFLTLGRPRVKVCMKMVVTTRGPVLPRRSSGRAERSSRCDVLQEARL